MSTLTEINRLQNAKADIVSAVESKGVSVDDAATMDDMAEYISLIEIGYKSVLSATQPSSQNVGDFWLKIK